MDLYYKSHKVININKPYFTGILAKVLIQVGYIELFSEYFLNVEILLF